MTAAALDDIEAAMFAQLKTLGPLPQDGTGLFQYVGRFAGEVSQQGIDQEILGIAPAALLAFAMDDTDKRQSIETLAVRAAQTVSRTTWLVYVIVEDPRGDEVATKGAVGANGILKCIQGVADALNGLVVPHLFHNDVVRYLSTRVRFIARGVCYCYALQFTTDREVDNATVVDLGIPFEGVNADINLEGEADVPPNPVVQFTVDTTP